MIEKIGILIVNTGTPDAPTQSAVRAYLREFLSDKHVVKIPRILWLPILYGLILPRRPKQSVQFYQKIWTHEGSPMRVIMQKLSASLQESFQKQPVAIELGMNYGQPSIQLGLENLRNQSVDRVIVLPLFPQYSDTTIASSVDLVKRALTQINWHPAYDFIQGYSSQDAYIHALASSVHQAWDKQQAAQHLLISFHGIPKQFIKNGDPYQSQCEQTTRLLANELKLSAENYTLCYQSRFGYAPWLGPSTQQLLAELPQRGIKNIDIICPGFAVDCLETLEEIAIRGEKIFLQNGGQNFRYIPALNASKEQLALLMQILFNYQLVL